MAVVEAGAGAERSRYAPGLVLANRFILRRWLAGGGSGEVWVASNRATGGPVAIKLVSASGSALNAARFRQEAALSAALAHRNIVRVFDFFDTRDGTLGLVMECLRGETARERLDRAGPLNPRAAVALVTQALAGLDHAHEHQIVHRDIKPPNLFLATDSDGSTTTKILDFGVAHTESNPVHTLHGQLLGTPCYMSPEQIRAEGPVDGRSDVFSTAIVLYELLTGRCPFAAPFSTASLAAVLESKVERDGRIPPPLWEVIDRALSKDRDARPPNARVFADALRAAVESSDGALARELHRSRPPPALLAAETSGATLVAIDATTPPPPPPAPTPPRAAQVRERALGIVAAVTAFSLAVLAAAAIRGGREKNPAPPPPVAIAPPSAPLPVAPPLATVAPAVSAAAVDPAVSAVAVDPATSATAASAPPIPASAAPVPAQLPAPGASRATPVRRPPAPAPASKGKIVRDPGF